MRAAVLLFGAAASTLGLVACGGDDFENKPRPPVPVNLTGVITADEVTVSPRRLGAGPVVLTVSNQTQDPHTITLDGERLDGRAFSPERVGPLNPFETATIQKTLPPGEYEVRAGSEAAVPEAIEPATVSIGEERESGKDTLLLP